MTQNRSKTPQAKAARWGITLGVLYALGLFCSKPTTPSGETASSASPESAALSALSPETAASPARAPAPRPAGTWRISGVARLDGAPPRPSVLKMDADPKCAALHKGERVFSQDVVMGEGGALANVFVYVKGGLGAAKHPLSPPAALDQRGCQYTPHVLGLMAGQKLNIINSDPTLHNIHAIAALNPEFNFGQPVPGVVERTFRKPEIGVKIKCDVHPWMGAWVHVLDHPFFAVSGPDGAFAIAGLPPGQYTLQAWHERLGTRELVVNIEQGDVAHADFAFAPPPTN